MSRKKIKSSKMYFANCAICGNQSSFDKESLKQSTHIVNGIKIVLCVFCEDDLFDILLKDRLSKKQMECLTENLMSDEREQVLSLYDRNILYED